MSKPLVLRMIGWTYLLVLAAQARSDVQALDLPDASPANEYYIGNRTPLVPSRLIKLPIACLRPEGWVRKQLELQANGFHGHLSEISRFLVKEGNAWLSPEGAGSNGWEEAPYWLKGFGDCAYLLDHQAQMAEARIWIEGALNSRRDDGFFGPRPGTRSTVSSTGGKYDLWPNMVMLMCLQSYYDVTGDARVMDLMTDYFRWQSAVPDQDFLPPFWQQQRAGDNLWSVLWLYNRTADSFLLELADKIHRHTAKWSDGIPNWHNVNMSQAFGGPAFYWLVSHDPAHRYAAERNWQTIRHRYGQVPGGMFGGDENCRPGFAGPRQAVETCGMVEMMYSCERLLNTTGNPVWADRCEDVAFNSLPAALTADFKSLRYLTAPNLIRSDRFNKSPGYQNGGPMLHFNPHAHRCCQHNFGHGWPYYAEYLWMATPGNGLAAVLFAASRVSAQVGDGTRVTIQERTQYPFAETVEFVVSTPRRVRFPLYLRVPGWCAQPRLRVNGERQAVEGKACGYLRIDRAWLNGDTVRLELPMQVSLRTWAANHNSVSVDRGPLTYSLKIGEERVREGGTEAWPAWEIHPTTPWNYGLVLDRNQPASSFQVVQKPWPGSDMPFTHEGVPLELRARGKRIPEWQQDHLGLVGALQSSPVRSEQPVEELTLIPMGAARLRISAFPVIGEGPRARRWDAPPEPLPYRASASHCWQNDTLDALKDQVIPSSSNDHGLARFTWWDRKGTTEWVQYDFDDARRIEAVEVFWFDDTPGGGCALPQSWRLLYRSGNEWREVSPTNVAPVVKDRFNRLTFTSVKADALRLEARLRPERSAGILEWRIE